MPLVYDSDKNKWAWSEAIDDVPATAETASDEDNAVAINAILAALRGVGLVVEE